MSQTKMLGWDRFKDLIGAHWDGVVEAGLGDPTPEESKAICELGYWGREITHRSVEGIKAGRSWKSLEKRAFIFTIYAPDGRHVHRHRSRKAMIEDVRRYGPPVHPRSQFSWADDDGYSYEIEGEITLTEIFPPRPEGPRRPLLPADAEPDFEKLYEEHMSDRAERGMDPREGGWL